MAADKTPGQSEVQGGPPLPAAATNALELLAVKIPDPNWEQSLAPQKSFHLRGVTWYHRNVMRKISELQKVGAEDIEAIFERHPAFFALALDWDEPFSIRQAMTALSARSRKPIKFTKAVLTLLLCDHVVRLRIADGKAQLLPDEALRRMRIEPAVFYIQDFDSVLLDQLQAARPQILDRLRSMTGQLSRVVFTELAKGHTVTRDLAGKTRAALLELFPDIEIGAVDCRYRNGTLSAAPTEVLTD